MKQFGHIARGCSSATEEGRRAGGCRSLEPAWRAAAGRRALAFADRQDRRDGLHDLRGVLGAVEPHIAIVMMRMLVLDRPQFGAVERLGVGSAHEAARRLTRGDLGRDHRQYRRGRRRASRLSWRPSCGPSCRGCGSSGPCAVLATIRRITRQPAPTSTVRDEPGSRDQVRLSAAAVRWPNPRPGVLTSEGRRGVHAGTMTERAVVSIGVGAAIGPELVGRLAPAIEAAGFHALWVNDIPGADSLAVLAAAARSTTRLTLAAGVIPVDRRSADQIAATVHEHAAAAGAPDARHRLGRGDRRRAPARGRRRRPSCAAASPRGSSSARWGRRCGSSRSTGPTACSSAGSDRMSPPSRPRRREPRHPIRMSLSMCARRSTRRRATGWTPRCGGTRPIPSYGANFARQGAVAAETVLDASAHPVAERLASYRAAVDEVVLRAITPSRQPGGLPQLRDRAAALL